MGRARRGDREAFSVLVERHASRVLSAAWRIVGTREEAEDVAQETFLAAYRSLGSFRGESLFSTWLYRIAVNKCRDRLRARPAEDERPAVTPAEDDAATELPGAALHHRTPEKLLEDAQRAGRIEEAIARLPALYREAFVLRHVEGLSYEEMSEVLGADGSTLRMRVYKARTQLSHELAGLER